MVVASRAAGQPPRAASPQSRKAAPAYMAVGEVAHPGEAPADRRRVAEHRVQLERRADEHVDGEQAEDGAEAEEQRVEAGRPADVDGAATADRRRHREHEDPVGARPGGVVEVDRAGRGRWRGGTPASSSAASATTLRHRGPPPSQRDGGADPQRGLEDDEQRRHRRAPCGRGSWLAASRSARSAARASPVDAPSAARSKRRPSIELGRSTPARSRIVGRDVDERDDPGAAGAPRPQQARLDVRAPAGRPR